MGRISLGMNLEATRHHDKPFEWGLDRAAELGYEYVEPMVHFGRELMSEAGYFHTVSMLTTRWHAGNVRERGVQISGLQAHGPLMRPDDHVQYLENSHSLCRGNAGRAGGQHRRRHRPQLDRRRSEDFTLMRYTLTRGARLSLSGAA